MEKLRHSFLHRFPVLSSLCSLLPAVLSASSHSFSSEIVIVAVTVFPILSPCSV